MRIIHFTSRLTAVWVMMENCMVKYRYFYGNDSNTPENQVPIIPHVNYDIPSSYDDDFIPGPSIKLKFLFEVIHEAPTGLPLTPKTDVLIYICTVL